MAKSFKRLGDGEREEISIGLAKGETMDAIGIRLGRPTSTISREVARELGIYRAYSAALKAKKCAGERRRGKTKIEKNSTLRAYIELGLRRNWSPKQIVKRLQVEYPQDMTMRISHEAIYQYIYVLPRGELKALLIKALRQEHKYRRTNKKDSGIVSEARGKLSDMLSIEERPPEVADRTIPGHWEGDLIIGKHKQSAIGTLVERTTRYTLIIPLPAKDTKTVRKEFARAIRTLPAELKKTLTYDQGKEMSSHKQFTLDTGMAVYFAHPGSPWERGTNENTNGLIRQYFPKGTDFRTISTREIKRVQRELNGRPRQVLDYAKPEEVFNKLVALKV